MSITPQSEHEWLHQFIGAWDFAHECDLGPDHQVSKAAGTMTARSHGGLWVVLDCQGEMPEGGNWTSAFTLGFDPNKDRFVGTFVASMMTHLWIYEGELDPDSNLLTLDVSGPRMDGQGMADYQDVFEIVDENRWVLRSRILVDGTWKTFMEGTHIRKD